MATRSAWVLNLDAEYELEDPKGYTPSLAARERVRAFAARARRLLQPGDIVLEDGAEPLAEHYRGRAWCPTPRALARLAAAGVVLPESPPLCVLQRVNDRRFGIELCPGPLATRYVSSLDAALACLREHSDTGYWLLKRAFGLSGRGHRRVRGAPTEQDERWLRNSFKHGHGVALEPWVEREADFAIHGWVPRAGDARLGRELMQRCDRHGAWQETLEVPAETMTPHERDVLRTTAEGVAEALRGAGYFGPFGIDAFRYRTPSGATRFQSMVEINARYSMGWPLSGLPA